MPDLIVLIDELGQLSAADFFDPANQLPIR
jgi:hypothetical protein